MTDTDPHDSPLQRRSQPPPIFKSRLFNDDNSEYLVNIRIGTPPQNFTVALDTGSADVWVPSIECDKIQCPLNRFDPSKSKTFEKTRHPFAIKYGIGKANGTYARDTMTIGKLKVAKQPFGLAKSTEQIITVPNTMTNKPKEEQVFPNGILGLGYPELSSSAVKAAHEPFIVSLAKKGVIREPVFSVHMNSMFHSGWSGELILGGVDEEKYTGMIQYLPVAKIKKKGHKNGAYAYWMVYGRSLHIADDDAIIFNAPFNKTRGVIIDTGTTLSYMDQALAEQIVLSVAGQDQVLLDETTGVFLVPCHLRQSPLELDLEFSTTYRASGPPVRLRLSVSNLVIPLNASANTLSDQCMFGIAPWLQTKQSSVLGSKGMILLGDSILRSTYLIFDAGRNRIGFASAQTPLRSVITGPKLPCEQSRNKESTSGAGTQSSQRASSSHRPQQPHRSHRPNQSSQGSGAERVLWIHGLRKTGIITVMALSLSVRFM
ncbi:aspartic peptidase domain-containing protein [Radiomyces spectabilis]|uniref:aspartic peptidase domain-containing protein n=1 Tax=Radiomyces spectabilis TaxID=64574 RepID=UPI00221EB365|nr:aspartic peptidase domain-containing protein [Radiomyces spectabilis]KAI8370630.1 aspartic peptidase domain-containing protein [Radiomyces spectabilis]